MAQYLYNVRVFFLEKCKHPSIWHNCNNNGVEKIKRFAEKKGIAYVEFYKPKTNFARPLFVLYFVDTYNVTIHYFNGSFEKKFGIIHIEDAIQDAKNKCAKSLSIYNVAQKKFDCTIYF